MVRNAKTAAYKLNYNLLLDSRDLRKNGLFLMSYANLTPEESLKLVKDE